VSPELQAFASGFPLMLLQLGLGLILFVVGCGAYALLSPNQEIRRIREGDTAAAVSFAGALIGLAIPTAAAIVATTSIVDLGLWATAALVLALLAFRVVDVVMAGLPQRMRDGEVAAGVVLVAARIAAALIIAAALLV
jgi:putative membrane protein